MSLYLGLLFAGPLRVAAGYILNAQNTSNKMHQLAAGPLSLETNYCALSVAAELQLTPAFVRAIRLGKLRRTGHQTFLFYRFAKAIAGATNAPTRSEQCKISHRTIGVMIIQRYWGFVARMRK